ncbi:helix-turn-helix transcriptional regulator [Asticcacaulis sp. EMRT-3]|uniref:helix-turn-helix domain-containing protein n=1 Tax=Asticcacaulis sp. EMRT-3 TaxID=3040349 RepID=UPI0024AF0765|nr:helix-turn-helix transcriptional regulator [Asticcacaulis sp. EMRT-3]MDI7774953.1 helix-turn-helix transcriptional regulator [Asticcacaulis sp. EMRT-3]
MEKTDSPLRRALAQNLRELRGKQGLSQEELADIAGLHRTFIGAVERCERNISLDNIGKLATALGVPAAELFREGMK